MLLKTSMSLEKQQKVKLSLSTNLKGPRQLVKRANLTLLPSNANETAQRIHVVLMSDLLLMCEQMSEAEATKEKKYWLKYPPLSTKFVVISGVEPQRERKFV